MKKLQPILSLTIFGAISLTSSAAMAQDLMITAVFDGPLSGGTPKGVELTVLNDIADLSVYGLGSANNGGGSDGVEFTFPAESRKAGETIHIATEIPQFTAFFGYAPDFESNAVSINGDDAIELFKDGVVVDLFGDIDVDGTGQPWEYLDGWAHRNASAPSTTFELSQWTFSGPDALDGATSNATASSPIPLTDTPDPAPKPAPLAPLPMLIAGFGIALGLGAKRRG